MKQIFLVQESPDAEQFFENLDGVRFKKKEPLAIIRVRSSAANSPDSKLDTKIDFVKAVRNYPKANAYRDVGIIETDIRQCEDPDPDKCLTIYDNIYEVELYHLGE